VIGIHPPSPFLCCWAETWPWILWKNAAHLANQSLGHDMFNSS
jgi:hypothetical protein